jgi:prepilin-type N-terminal cleavage/methylation domain-containing protein
MNRNFKQGFTLIELLVVIAIIGILSAVVLASLNSARAKGQDAAIKSNLNNMRAQAELFYDSNGSVYTNACVTANNPQMVAALNSANNSNGAGVVVCNAQAGTWVIAADLQSVTPASYYCVDSTGVSKTTAGTVTAAFSPTGAFTSGNNTAVVACP